MLLKQLNLQTGKMITPELRRFALTLNFYSASAYNYVRNTFNKCLPHPSTLREWYSSVNGEPGITFEALNAISIKVEEMKTKNKTLVCGLLMDEMYIKEDIHYNCTRLQGYVNYGTGTDESDAMPKAKEALTFMLVALNSNWKVPIAYFLINGITSEDKANLVNICLTKVHDTGIVVKSLTFDGAAANISMSKYLGAQLSISDLKPYFNHPVTKEKIHILLDAAHMLKLCRNTLGDWKILIDKNGETIKWVYFQHLVNLLDKVGLHAGTKIRRRHITYFKEKMKVKLATQTFSNSVANAIEFCSKTLNLNEFNGSESTIQFCKIMNDIFDLLNARNFLSKEQFKKPINLNNAINIKEFINKSINYLSNIQCETKSTNEKTLIITSSRKTGFLGLIICLKTIENLIDDVLVTKQMDFLLTYKLSQDHIEMFFSAIRFKGGFNNNPTAAQLEAAYKRLIVHTELATSSEANCLPIDRTNILTISSTQNKSKNAQNEDFLDLLCAEVESDNDGNFIIDQTELQYTHNVIEYIAGFVARKLKKKFYVMNVFQ